MKYLESTDSNGTELYLFQLEGNLFISVPKDRCSVDGITSSVIGNSSEKPNNA